jgi:hypothetical protein
MVESSMIVTCRDSNSECQLGVSPSNSERIRWTFGQSFVGTVRGTVVPPFIQDVGCFPPIPWLPKFGGALVCETAVPSVVNDSQLYNPA